MKPTLTITATCLAVGSLAIAATNSAKRLTPERIAELTAPTESTKLKGYKVEITGLEAAFPKGAMGQTSVVLPADKPQAVLEYYRELRFPTAFTLPTAKAQGETPFQAIGPAEFETVHTGWKIRLSSKPHGKVVALSGIADYTEAEMVSGGYGPLAEPIYSDTGKLLSPNALQQPKLQTTTTRFHIFAVPGESYEVTLYRGANAEKHRVTVAAE